MARVKRNGSQQPLSQERGILRPLRTELDVALNESRSSEEQCGNVARLVKRRDVQLQAQYVFGDLKKQRAFLATGDGPVHARVRGWSRHVINVISSANAH